MILHTYDALSITVGVSIERPGQPNPNAVPTVSLNFRPAVAHELAEQILIPYAKPEHALISFQLGDNCCEVTAWLAVPVPGGLAVAGNIADINLESIGRFLDAKAKFNRYIVGLGYHDANLRVTRRADVSWHLVVEDIIPRQIVDERMAEILRRA